MRTRAVALGALALGVVACNAIFGDTAQCSTDADCASFGTGYVCGPTQTCLARGGGGPTTNGTDGGASSDAGEDAASVPGGPLDHIDLTPKTVSVEVGSTQSFIAFGWDATNHTPTPAPVFEWSVSGGGTIGSTGIFTATTAGAFTVTVKSGSITATATGTVTTTPFKVGETNILATDDSGNADLVLAQVVTLPRAATIQSLSFYVATAAGNLRLGIYDATGPNGGPGAKKAETAEFAAQAGWTAVPVTTPVALPAGNYWLAYAPSDSGLHFELAGDGTGKLAYFSSPYGPLPATFSTTPTTQNDHWSFYATFTP